MSGVVKVYEPILCPGCGQVRGVNNDGRIRAHAAPSGARWEDCAGTRMKVPVASASVRGGLW